MPTLQVCDLPEEVYNQINYLAEKEHRSLTQETIILLKEGIEYCLDLVDDYIETKNICREVFAESIKNKHSS